MNDPVRATAASACYAMLGYAPGHEYFESDIFNEHKANLIESLAQAGEVDGAHDFEVERCGARLNVIDTTASITLTLDPATGATVATDNDEPGSAPVEPAQSSAPVAYYRVLVNQAAVPFFRTSRLHNVGAMASAYRGMRAGFPASFDFGVSVLAVDTDRVGRILAEDETLKLIACVP